MQFLGRTSSCRTFGFIHERKTPAAGQAAGFGELVSLHVRALPAAKAQCLQVNSAGFPPPPLQEPQQACTHFSWLTGWPAWPSAASAVALAQFPGPLKPTSSRAGSRLQAVTEEERLVPPAGAQVVRGKGWRMELETPTQGSSDPCTARISHLSSSPSLSCGRQELCWCLALAFASPASFPDSPFPAAQLSSATAPGWLQFVFHDVRSDSS